jgi:hypothetical protein
MNAPEPLFIDTPDGSNQAVHPDVVDCGEPFLGYRYWMAMTPYPDGNDRHENPCIRVSHDGLSWDPFPGCPDPLVGAPAVPAHFADTDLVIHDGELRVFFIIRDKALEHTTVLCVRSVDGASWTEPQPVYDAGWAVSPAVVVCDGRWYMWFVRTNPRVAGSQSMVLRAESRDGLSFGNERECRVEIPGHRPWHIDVVGTEAGWEAFVAGYPVGQDPASSRLFHASAPDGISFSVTAQPILAPSRWSWDNRMIYRSSATKGRDGRYRLWYSAASWGERYGIGYIEGLPGAWKAARQRGRRFGVGKMAADLRGRLKYLVLRHSPPVALRVLRAASRLARRA